MVAHPQVLCVCVCARARARARVCVCVRVMVCCVTCRRVIRAPPVVACQSVVAWQARVFAHAHTWTVHAQPQEGVDVLPMSRSRLLRGVLKRWQ